MLIRIFNFFVVIVSLPELLDIATSRYLNGGIPNGK